MGIDMKVPSAGGSVEAIFSLACDPGTMRIVISDPKLTPCQLEEVWDEICFFEKFSILVEN